MLTLIYISQPRATLCPSEYIPLVFLFLLRKKYFFLFPQFLPIYFTIFSEMSMGDIL